MALLKQGNRGADVADLVKDLRKIGFQLAQADVFDATVKKSVEAFQTGKVDAAGQPLKVDGKVGDNTRWALDAAVGKKVTLVTVDIALPPLPPGGSAAGRLALGIAITEVTNKAGEKTGDNRGPDIVRYFDSLKLEGSSWCAAFVSYCFKTALGHNAEFGYIAGAQAVHQKMTSLGRAYTASLANPPQPGDIIVWKRVDPKNAAKTAWQGHVGLVHSFADGILWTIEGNRGAFPAKVRPFHYKWTDLVISAKNDAFKGLFGLSRHS